MSEDIKSSVTKINLMKAFAGESQARNRYIFAAEEAKKQKLHIIEAVFKMTAEQEEQHAKVFLDHLKELNGGVIDIDAAFPVNSTSDISELLKFAIKNETEEYDVIYKDFGNKASDEGFTAIANSFRMIGEIEKNHAEKFRRLCDLLSGDKLFVSDVSCKWMCLNCGHIFDGTNAPAICPVCGENRGYFIQYELSPYCFC